ncbi:hypothetical protein ACW9KT_21535 [Hymenobacter sp. HD11105]
MKYALIITIFFFSISCYAQDDFSSWDEKYASKGYKNLIAEEKAYLDKVKREEKEPHDYSRFDTYKLRGNFTGKSRIIDPKVMQSMKVVCWAWPKYLPKPESLEKLISKEYLFIIEGIEVWMPIQKVLENPLKAEVKIGETATLYCVFFNEFRLNSRLYNTLMISEFRK